MQIDIKQPEAISALAHFRQTVLVHANALLGPVQTEIVDEPIDTRPSAVSLLAASLEELKVAEEELRETNGQLEARQHEVDVQTHFYRQLFLCAPQPALVTDARGTIVEVNFAAEMLFQRDARLLEGKPLAALVTTSDRNEFRQLINRISADRPVSDWSLTVRRVRDVPARVSAAVARVGNLGGSRSDVLYWTLRTTRNDI